MSGAGDPGGDGLACGQGHGDPGADSGPYPGQHQPQPGGGGQRAGPDHPDHTECPPQPAGGRRSPGYVFRETSLIILKRHDLLRRSGGPTGDEDSVHHPHQDAADHHHGHRHCPHSCQLQVGEILKGTFHHFNSRGSEIYQTVTEHNVVTQTTTDYSVQTLLNFVPASEPFYPLAPTLHR